MNGLEISISDLKLTLTYSKKHQPLDEMELLQNHGYHKVSLLWWGEIYQNKQLRVSSKGNILTLALKDNRQGDFYPRKCETLIPTKFVTSCFNCLTQ